MTGSIVLRLMLKDWYLSRTFLTIVGLLGAVSIASLYLGHGPTSVLGMVVSRRIWSHRIYPRHAIGACRARLRRTGRSRY